MSDDIARKLRDILKTVKKLDKTVELYRGEVHRLSKICWILTSITVVIEKRGEFSKNLWNEWVIKPSGDILKFQGSYNKEVISKGIEILRLICSIDIDLVDWKPLLKIIKAISSHLYSFESYRATQTEGVLL